MAIYNYVKSIWGKGMVYSQTEICDEIANLTSDDLKRLKFIALRFLDKNYTYNDASDLVQEAIVQALEGRWSFKKDIAFLNTLARMIRSLATRFKEKGQSDKKLVQNISHSDSLYDDDTNVEEYDINIDKRILLLSQNLEDDSECKTLFQFKLTDISKNQIIEQMKITQNEYDTIYRRMKRKLSKIRLNEASV